MEGAGKSLTTFIQAKYRVLLQISQREALKTSAPWSVKWGRLSERSWEGPRALTVGFYPLPPIQAPEAPLPWPRADSGLRFKPNFSLGQHPVHVPRQSPHPPAPSSKGLKKLGAQAADLFQSSALSLISRVTLNK